MVRSRKGNRGREYFDNFAFLRFFFCRINYWLPFFLDCLPWLLIPTNNNWKGWKLLFCVCVCFFLSFFLPFHILINYTPFIDLLWFPVGGIVLVYLFYFVGWKISWENPFKFKFIFYFIYYMKKMIGNGFLYLNEVRSPMLNFA